MEFPRRESPLREFPLSRQVARRLEYLPEARSTNDGMVRRAIGTGWPDLSVLVTDNQTAGRGRLGRPWASPAGTALAVSVLLRPRLADGAPLLVDRYGWFSLLAGLAATRAVASVLAVSDAAGAVTLKWPNDVLIDGRKVCGILSELLPDAAGVVIGTGINIAIEAADLPTDSSTSLLVAGAREPDPDAVLAGYLTELTTLYATFLAAGGDAEASGVHDAVSRACGTLGALVRVELPSGEIPTGTATRIDDAGRLVVSRNGTLLTVAAGDVTHLRY